MFKGDVMEAYLKEIIQWHAEIDEFAELLVRERVSSYLEIGSKWGGALWRVASRLPRGSRVVSVDMPRGTVHWEMTEKSLTRCVMNMNEKLGHVARVIWGDSTDSQVVMQVRALGPFDACFIDANHTLPYVTRDWENYGRDCRIAAFHDIAWAPRKTKYPVEVPEFWNELKRDHRHVEIKRDPTGKNNGIGVVFRA